MTLTQELRQAADAYAKATERKDKALKASKAAELAHRKAADNLLGILRRTGGGPKSTFNQQIASRGSYTG